MNWKTFLSRILLIAVAFPVIGALIFLLPQLHHLAFNLLVAGASVVGALETRALVEARKIPTARHLAPILAGTFPLVTWLQTAGYVPAAVEWYWLAGTMGVILLRAVFLSDDRNLQGFLSFVSSSLFVLLYPAFFLSWIVRFSGLAESSLSILLFLGLVFGNDMSAYFAGTLWGRATRLNLPISPQKTAVGFIAGIVGSLIIFTAFQLLAPHVVPESLPLGILLTVLVGVAVILGDLVESGLKRSAGVKDSGIVIPGRGGMLDSVDSMVLSAPLFYGLLRLFGR
ncbi:MAG TPA: phosphatidate cytidylyltransferase [Spirochaetia bacterium]|nr:phosphatidate cytidylyltransferase [Spirochaetia bacterium]